MPCPMLWTRTAIITAALAGLSLSTPVAAQRGGWGGGWGGPGWGMMGPPGGYYGPDRGGRDPREGKVEATTFVASSPNVGALGHGPIALASGPGSMGSGMEDATFESALVDQLAKAGYRTDAAGAAGGQVVEYVISHDVVRPEEPPHNPVSGEVALGAGNRGSAVGLGVDIDLSKPLKTLVATRLEARIRDSATNELLWEGRARVITREGDKHWTGQALATGLAAALFKGFPRPTAIGGY
jgi:hypothetical protein